MVKALFTVPPDPELFQRLLLSLLAVSKNHPLNLLQLLDPEKLKAFCEENKGEEKQESDDAEKKESTEPKEQEQQDFISKLNSVFWLLIAQTPSTPLITSVATPGQHHLFSSTCCMCCRYWSVPVCIVCVVSTGVYLNVLCVLHVLEYMRLRRSATLAGVYNVLCILMSRFSVFICVHVRCLLFTLLLLHPVALLGVDLVVMTLVEVMWAFVESGQVNISVIMPHVVKMLQSQVCICTSYMHCMHSS